MNTQGETHRERRQCEIHREKDSSTSQEERLGTDHSLISLRKKQPCQHLEFGFLAYRTVGQFIFIV
jgi:hypothetical protein